MKHISRVTKPATAAANGPLTNWGKVPPNPLGLNEYGDFVLVISNFVNGLPIIGGFMPDGVGKSGTSAF